MAKLSFDYSRFDNIVDSDDETTHHPNLDRGLNQRVVRITRDRKEETIDEQKKKLEDEGKFEEAERLEKQRPLHMGNIGRVAEERTIINSAHGTKDRLVKDGEEFRIDEYSGFTEDNQSLLNAFVDADWERSRALLAEHGDALLDECANSYFMLQSLEEEMLGNTDRVAKLVHQGQIVSQIRQLAQAMKRPPRDFVHRFFDRFQTDAGKQAFQEGADSFLGHIKRRAVEKKQDQTQNESAKLMSAESDAARSAMPLVEAMYDMKPEVRKRLAPKGLDPVKVYEALPEKLKLAFKTVSVPALQDAQENMDPAEFERHFQLCKDSGLWEEELNAFVHVSAQ
jgi:hypothetical protein